MLFRSDWGQDRLLDDARWKWGTPPAGNANYAWISHMISKLSPKGTAAFVLANGSLSTNQKDEYEIRKNIIEEGLVDCIISMPSQLFYDVSIPVSLWFISKDKENRKNKILFIDASNMGYMESRRHRELRENEITKLYQTYHNWKKEKNYQDEEGFSKSATLNEVKEQDYVLAPARYVGIEEELDDGVPFEVKFQTLKDKIEILFKESENYENEIMLKLKEIDNEL